MDWKEPVSYTHLDVYKRQLYISDMPRLPGTSLAMFADDTAVYAVDRRAETAVTWLQKHLDVYVEWAEKWMVAINAAKSTAVVFSLSLIHI